VKEHPFPRLGRPILAALQDVPRRIFRPGGMHWRGRHPCGDGPGGLRLGCVFHDAVVAAACPGAAGAGAVAAEHLRGGPAVQLHQIPLGTAPVEPGVAEVMPEPPGLCGPAGTADPVRVGRGSQLSVLVVLDHSRRRHRHA
jgi:hypothetical protein